MERNAFEIIGTESGGLVIHYLDDADDRVEYARMLNLAYEAPLAAGEHLAAASLAGDA